MFEHVNVLNVRQAFFERLKQILAPNDFAALLRKLKRKRDRAEKRARRAATYPYSSTRQNARYARQIKAGQLKFA